MLGESKGGVQLHVLGSEVQMNVLEIYGCGCMCWQSEMQCIVVLGVQV